jgi:hypothetical protein
MEACLSPSRSIRNSGRLCCRIACNALATGAISCAAGPVAAHGFGQRYELPLPLSYYLFGVAAAVAVSFVIFGLFVRHAPIIGRGHRFDLLATPLGRVLTAPAVVLALRFVIFALFIVTVAAGWLGDQNPYRNIAPTLVWVIWWVGFAYVSALLGNLWALINPWRTAFDVAEWLWRRFGGRSGMSFGLPYPPALGVWPACLFLLAFAWTELVFSAPAVPANIACLAIGYSVLTFAGMILFGRDVWLAHGEVFSSVFGLYARFSPIESRDRRLLLRPFGAGLLEDRPASVSMVALVLLLLATVLYDGLLTTPAWAWFESASAPLLGRESAVLLRTLGLIGTWLLFSVIYGAVAALMSLAAGGRLAPPEVARAFAFTLIPIAIGYHVAHYLVFLLVQGQYIIPLASDPFGFGWNLFGTADYRVDIALVGARFSWYAAVIAILGGHVTAVYLAHVKAMQVIAPRTAALGSQIPLTALMVVYTFTGLSIIAEPIVERATPAAPSGVIADAVQIPADALTPEPGTGLLRPVGPDKFAVQELTYRVLGSAFHDGSRIAVADLLYAYAFAYRWGSYRADDMTHYDPSVDASTKSLRGSLAALRVAGIDSSSKTLRVGDVNFVRELFIVDVFTNTKSDDVAREAAFGAPWSTLPWHVLMLMEEAVSRGWAAFSQAEATRRGVPWLDLVRSREVIGKLASLVDEFERDGRRPDALQALVTNDDARKRWAALAAFHKAHGHFLVTNGPYRLKQWSGDKVTLEAFRDLSYPLGVGSYDAYAVPRRGFVTEVERKGNSLIISGDVEIVEKFQRSRRLVRTPLGTLGADVRRRMEVECRYTVLDENHRVVAADSIRLGEDNPIFTLNFERRLPTGRHTVFALIAVRGNVMNAEIRRIPFVVGADP